MTRSAIWYLTAICVLHAPLIASAADKIDSQQLQQLRSLLSNRCFACHGPDAAEREGGFRMDQGDSIYQPADSGKTPVVPSKPDESELLLRIVSTDDDQRMPPPAFGKPLEKQEVEMIRQWIANGAPALKHWSFVPPSRTETASPHRTIGRA